MPDEPVIDLSPNKKPCPICGRVMMYRGGLIFHAKQAHNLDLTQGGDVNLSDDSSSPRQVLGRKGPRRAP